MSALTSGAIEDLLGQLEDAATDSALTPAERTARLTYLRSQITTVLGRADAYLADVRLSEQAEQIRNLDALLAVREAADIRTELLRRDMATVEKLEEAGVPSHEELDRLGEEGLLMEFAHGWLERLHPRDRTGKWTRGFGKLEPPKGREHAQPKVLHAPREKPLRQDLPEAMPSPPPVQTKPHPDLAYKEDHLLPEEKKQVETMRAAHLSEDERLKLYRERSSVFDKKVEELAAVRLTSALAKLTERDPVQVVVHPEDVNDFLAGHPYGKVLFHGTPKQNVESILTGGVRPSDSAMDMQTGRPTVFLTNQADLAKRHGTAVPVATALDNPLIVQPDESAAQAMQRVGASTLDSFDGMVRVQANGTEIVTAWQPTEDLRVVTDEPVIDPAKLDTAELQFNAAGSINQHTLGEFARAVAGEPDTVELHSTEGPDGTRTYTPERRKLHAKIVDLFLRQRRWDENAGEIDKATGRPRGEWMFCPDCDQLEGVENPQVLFSGGGYSAGKGTVVKKLVKKIVSGYEGPVLTLDPDEIKAMLPEFRDRFETDPLANAVVYREAWDIAQQIQQEAQARKLNMVVDGISDTTPDEMLGRVQHFLDQGYSAKAVYVDIPTEEALKRAEKRSQTSKEKKDRRMIPTLIMQAVHRDVAATVPAMARRVQREGIPLDIEVWDNNQGQDANGAFIPPKQFFGYSHGDKEPIIHDEALWAAFRAKAREKLSVERAKMMETVYSEHLHPRDRIGRWIDVLHLPHFAHLPHAESHEKRREQLARELHARASEAEPGVSGVLQAVAQEAGGKLEGFDFRIKTEESIIDKLKRWQRESERDGEDVTPDDIARRIGDTLRYTAVFDEEHYVEAVRSAVTGLTVLGYRQVEFENYWYPDEDYSGINAQFIGPDGQPVELQFHTPTSYHVKEHVNWPIYKKHREADGYEEKLRLWQEMVENGRQIRAPRGVTNLAPLTRRDPLHHHHTSVEGK